jgi:hypothetical protein
VDATGNIVQAGPELQGTFDGAVELASKLAQSADVRNCVANQWFRPLGRMESTNDSCSVAACTMLAPRAATSPDRAVMSPSFRNVLNGG